jgi:hypothetical protein
MRTLVSLRVNSRPHSDEKVTVVVLQPLQYTPTRTDSQPILFWAASLAVFTTATTKTSC